MDCEKFDHDVMDALYGELDELAFEALKRHVDACSRCGAAWAQLKATREAMQIPLAEPSMELERRILAAERTAHGHAPWYRKAIRALAWAGSHAMRPQFAMAALFLFVIGSSLLLLRPGTLAPPVHVSEQGKPENKRDPEVPKTASPAAGKADAESVRDMPLGRTLGAAPAATAAAQPKSSSTPSTSPVEEDGTLTESATRLTFALAKKAADGCHAAIPLLQSLVADFPDSPEKSMAQREIAECETGGMSRSGVPTSSASTTSSAQSSTGSGPPAPAPKDSDDTDDDDL